MVNIQAASFGGLYVSGVIAKLCDTLDYVLPLFVLPRISIKPIKLIVGQDNSLSTDVTKRLSGYNVCHITMCIMI